MGIALVIESLKKFPEVGLLEILCSFQQSNFQTISIRG